MVIHRFYLKPLFVMMKLYYESGIGHSLFFLPYD